MLNRWVRAKRWASLIFDALPLHLGHQIIDMIKDEIMKQISRKICEADFDDILQDCSNSSALAMELLQSYAKLSISSC